MKGHTTFLKTLILEAPHQMQVIVMPRTLVGGGSYPSAEEQLAYSTAPVNRACSYIYIYIYVCWPIVVEGDLKALFSIAIKLSCTGGRYSFPRIVPLTLDPYFIMLNVTQGGIKYHFLVLGMN